MSRLMHVIWKEDEWTDFSLEHAWRLLKDQLKWLEQFTKNCSKRMKTSASGAYSSSSNPKTLVEDVEAGTPSPIIRPMGQKTTKRKSKGKRVWTSTNPVDLTGVEEAMREINVLKAKLAALREKELEKEYYDILIKDNSKMSETWHKDHQAFCKMSSNKKGCGTNIWCAQISIRNYMWPIVCLKLRYNEGYNVGMHYIALHDCRRWTRYIQW